MSLPQERPSQAWRLHVTTTAQRFDRSGVGETGGRDNSRWAETALVRIERRPEMQPPC